MESKLMNDIPSIKEFMARFDGGRVPIDENIDEMIGIANTWAKENNYQIQHIVFIPLRFNSGMYKVFYTYK